MDVQITPEPTEAERAAIMDALEAEAQAEAVPTPWRRAALEAADEADARRRPDRA